MPYFKTCPVCGAHLDPGERCDCMKKAPNPLQRVQAHRETITTSIPCSRATCNLSMAAIIYQRSIVEMVHGITDADLLRQVYVITEALCKEDRT